MSVILGSPQRGFCVNWRLGPDTDPGWFDTSGPSASGQFVLATMFELHWEWPGHPPDGIYNILHAVTMGHADRSSKTHLEQLAQILHGNLHLTCRTTDSAGRVYRNTVALPDSWQHYQNRTMLLMYTAHTVDHGILDTMNVLYDIDDLKQLQCLPYRFAIETPADIDFATWPEHSVICDHEQNNLPRNHIIIHGNCLPLYNSHTEFEIRRVWGSLDQTLDPLDLTSVRALIQDCVPDNIGSTQAWYNCNCVHYVEEGKDTWAICTGRYNQRDSLGIKLHQTTLDAAAMHK